MPNPRPPIVVNFDFRSYVPNQNLSDGTVQLDGLICNGQSLVITVLANNLIPGHSYRTTYELVSPATDQNVFNPSVSDLYASFSTQNFVTTAVMPASPTIVTNYILKATVKDITEGFTDEVSAQINLVCGSVKPGFSVEILDQDTVQDQVMQLGDCTDGFPLIGVVRNAEIGKEYAYEFINNPPNSILYEKRTGEVFAGDVNQNFNSKIALTGYPYVFVHASVTEKDTGTTRLSEPVLLKCFQTNECDVALPTGVDCAAGVPTFRKCVQRGLTLASINNLSGGSKFSIGDKLTTTGGGGTGAEIEIISGGITVDTFSSFSGGGGFDIGDLIAVTGGGGTDGLIKIITGGLTNESITTLTGCYGFKVGDLFTTIGGEGTDALIEVTATGVNGSINTYNVINSGHGFVNVPTGIVPLNSNGVCVTTVFNPNNYTIPAAGGITNASTKLEGGTCYNIGEVLDIVGGGGTGAQAKIISGTLTSNSINTLSGGMNYSIGDYLTTVGGDGLDTVIRVTGVGPGGSINGWSLVYGGYNFHSAPTGLGKITGSGSGVVTFNANADNFSITSLGSITKASIGNFVNNGIGYQVGSKLFVGEGGGNGGLIEIVGVNNAGQVSNYVILNGGSNYKTVPVIYNDNQTAINPQPTWNISKFTKPGFVIINAGGGYVNSPTDIISTSSSCDDAIYFFTTTSFTDPAYIVLNSGSGYTSAPTGILIITGDGEGVVATFNADNFTIPCVGGITYDSISGLLNKTTFIDGEELIVDGGGGSGGRVRVTAVDNGAITEFVIVNAGCNYTSTPTLKKLNGTVVENIVFDPTEYTQLAYIVSNPGFGYVDIPTGLVPIVGDGQTDTIAVSFNDQNFVELIGPAPTPTVTPTPTITPSASMPVLCNSTQSAGGQNIISETTLSIEANANQNQIIVPDVRGIAKDSIVFGQGIPAGTYITNVQNFFANFDNRILYKKLTLNNNLIADLPIDSPITVFVPDIRLVKVPYWPGVMTFAYDAYSVPDRFKVFAVPIDSRLPDIPLFDSGYRGDTICGWADVLSGEGAGTATLNKPDGCIFIKVVVEAPCEGTAWEYSLTCPERVFTTFVTPTPTSTPTTTPTPSRL